MSVIVLLADGVRTDTLTQAVASGEFPALAQLQRSGGMHEVTSAFPSVTGPAYAPFLMGRFPGSIGLPGLRWFDRARTTCSFPDYSRSYVGYQMGAIDRDLDPNASTIFELVPDSVGALSMITRGLPKRRQMAPLARNAWRAVRTHFRGDVSGWLDVDRMVSERLVTRVRTQPTPFAFAAFTGVDKVSHASGHESERVREAIRIVDDTVSALLECADKDTRIWVTSDHGHSRVRHHEDLARVIGGYGFRGLAHPWVYRLGADVAVMVSGNAMAHVYVDLARRERPFLRGMSEGARELAERLLARDSVDLLLLPIDENSCAVWSRSRGRSIVSRRGDRFSYTTAEGDVLCVGRELADVDANAAHAATMTTDYPDAIVQIARLTAAGRVGDIILSASRDWDFRARYEPIPHVSSHGALHRDHMLVPLLLDRAPSRAPRRTADVMPSALEALGQPIPSGLDGESFV